MEKIVIMLKTESDGSDGQAVMVNEPNRLQERHLKLL
jgi:hypothetical protein